MITKPDYRIQYRRDLWRLFLGVPATELGGAAEIGVAEGNFSEDILKMPVKFPFVYLVDRWRCVPTLKGDSANSQIWHEQNYDKVVARVMKYGPRVVIIREDSVSAAERIEDRSLSLVYVDADHSYQGVVDDIRAWFPKLKKKGWMAFHDFENPAYGVKRAVTEFCKEKSFNLLKLSEDKLEDAGAYFQYE